ncbi:hypothetical protein [Streptomyces hyaluromycini]|uniref:hypothetical protein n=1 Tax=Streptomyces hyaluromycini TaxID=1377993 RepID=UPI000B5CDB36|nr:hypothetical protein [Streptomyces hyaluromycini]
MANDEKPGKDRADELQELIDQLTSDAASGTGAPTGPRSESLREAVHRRMRELDDASQADEEATEEDPRPDDESS